MIKKAQKSSIIWKYAYFISGFSVFIIADMMIWFDFPKEPTLYIETVCSVRTRHYLILLNKRPPQNKWRMCIWSDQGTYNRKLGTLVQSISLPGLVHASFYTFLGLDTERVLVDRSRISYSEKYWERTK